MHIAEVAEKQGGNELCHPAMLDALIYEARALHFETFNVLISELIDSNGELCFLG